MGATAITPNREESSTAVGFEITEAETTAKAADYLFQKLELEAVVITLDKDGAYLKTENKGLMVPTRPRSVYDVTGAGDMVLATLTATLAAGCDYESAVQLSNIASGIEVEKFGTSTVTIEEIADEISGQNRTASGKILTVDSLLKELARHRRKKRTIVFTNGCFDVLHRGHIEYLKFCRQQGDVVVVGLNSDSSVKMIKGPDRPINNQHDRASLLAVLEMVDYITIFSEPTPTDLIRKVRPDVLVKGEDWAVKGVVGREFVESYGGKVALAPLVENKSSTATIEKIKSLET
jgi:D-beta-D-heptose 7-phosphate kinase/D-beta-D-heptose 1-phosphate adenosyltransferase